MKSMGSKALVYACVFLLGFAAISAAGYVFGWAPVSGLAAMEQVNKYEVRSYLLMRAMGSVGACSASDAARVWAEGLAHRSGAQQYAVMTAALKDKYAHDLESTFQNWVTGGSSPWVQRYEIAEDGKAGEDGQGFRLRFFMESSAGPGGVYGARLTVVKDGDFWRIAKVEQDKELYAYTGFAP
jgi:hypothetical protein